MGGSMISGMQGGMQSGIQGGMQSGLQQQMSQMGSGQIGSNALQQQMLNVQRKVGNLKCLHF